MVDQIKLKVTVLLPSTNAVWGNVMFYTCQSLCSRGGGVPPHCMLGYTHTLGRHPPADIPLGSRHLRGRHPTRQTHPPPLGRHAPGRHRHHPPPPPNPLPDTTKYGQQATGTHLLERILLVGILLFSLSLALDEIVTISVRKNSPGAISSSLTRCPSDLGNILAVL